MKHLNYSERFVQYFKEELVKSFLQELSPILQTFIENSHLKEDEELLTRKETCKLLKINLSTLWLWTKKGRLKSYGKGNRVYYKRSEILESLTDFSSRNKKNIGS